MLACGLSRKRRENDNRSLIHSKVKYLSYTTVSSIFHIHIPERTKEDEDISELNPGFQANEEMRQKTNVYI